MTDQSNTTAIHRDVASTQRALARSIEIWVRDERVSPDFLAARLAEYHDFMFGELTQRLEAAEARRAQPCETRRERIATSALPACLELHQRGFLRDCGPAVVAETALEVADALIAALNATPQSVSAPASSATPDAGACSEFSDTQRLDAIIKIVCDLGTNGLVKAMHWTLDDPFSRSIIDSFLEKQK